MPTKILAIDDSKTMRLAVKITFAAEDADVTSVGKGGDAVARASQLGADIVLVDANLADGENGYDVCRALKSDGSTSSIPVLMLVSNKTGVDEGRLAEVGGDGWIAKPFDTQQLIDKVAELVGKPAARPSAAAAAARPAAAAPAAAPARPAPAPARPAAPAAPAMAARPAPAAPAPRPAAAPPRPAVAAPAPARPAATPAARPAQRTQMGLPTPAPKPVPSSAGNGADGAIPIAIPIPFTAATAPTAGMLERIQQAAGGGSIDPQVAQALAALSREVVERIVWEVVPELAESIIRESQARSA